MKGKANIGTFRANLVNLFSSAVSFAERFYCRSVRFTVKKSVLNLKMSLRVYFSFCRPRNDSGNVDMYTITTVTVKCMITL